VNLTRGQGRYAKNAKPDLDQAWPQPALVLGLKAEKKRLWLGATDVVGRWLHQASRIGITWKTQWIVGTWRWPGANVRSESFTFRRRYGEEMRPLEEG